jgi:hypothetical protein
MSNRKRLPNRRSNSSIRFECDGFSYLATAGYFDDGALAEIFLEVPGKAGTAVASAANTAAILASLLLQHGVAATDIEHSVTGPIRIALKMFSERRQ